MSGRQSAPLRKGAAAATIGAFLLTGAGVAVSAEAAPPAGTTWTLVAGDEFDGTTLDTSKWDANGFWFNTGPYQYKADNYSVDNGLLNIYAKKETYLGQPYTAGQLQSKFSDPGNGSYLEVRAKTVVSAANVYSAIWLFNGPAGLSTNPNPEIDLNEMLDPVNKPNVIQSHLHEWVFNPDGSYNGHVDAGGAEFNAGTDLSAGFHNYGLERRDNWLIFSVDGDVYWRENVTNRPEFVTAARHVMLDIEGQAGNPNDSYLPAAFQVDYVRVYQKTAGANGPNLIQNSSFEAQSGALPGWSEWSDTSASYGDYHPGGTHSGVYKLTHKQQDAAFSVATYESLSGIPNGTYTLKAWVATSDPAHYTYSKMYVKNYGGADQIVPVGSGNSWHQISISNIQVTNGQAEVGFSTLYPGGTGDWVVFDDVEFYRQ